MQLKPAITTAVTAFCIITILLINPAHANHGEIHVGLLFTGKTQLENFETVASNFTTQTQIGVVISSRYDLDYKSQFAQWMHSDSPPDVVHWQGGPRLEQYVNAGLIAPTTELWTKYNWAHYFSAPVIEQIQFNDEIYALPYFFYVWGLYYNAPMLKNADRDFPSNWDQLLDLCAYFTQHDTALIAIGTKDQWTAEGWFDYITLRLHGINFYQDLTGGLISYHDRRVRDVFLHWQQLIKNKCFISNTNQYKWHEALPYLYHRQAFLTLIGSFATNQFSSLIADNIKFAPFPVINPAIPRYENAPMDILVIPEKSKNLESAKAFLAYLAEPENAAALVRKTGMLSPNSQAHGATNYFSQAALETLEKAAAFNQFFDRQVSPEMDKLATPIIADFLNHADIDKTIEALEKARLATQK